MIVKDHDEAFSALKILGRMLAYRKRNIIVVLFMLGLISAVAIGGIYYGTTLMGSTYGSIFASFYRYFRPSLNIVSHYTSGLFSTPDVLYIDMKHDAYQRLSFHVENARKRHFITEEEKAEEVKAKITLNGEQCEVKIRLRGTFIEHIRGDKWSFRIKVKDDDTIYGMSRFSLSSPELRSHIHEWVYQQALKKEGLLNIRYKFVKVYLNGKNLGIYALEEFFDKRLLEHNGMREGIIVKPNMNVGNGNMFLYQEAKTLADSTLSRSYENLVNNVKLAKKKVIPVSKIYDIKKTAKYFAINEIFGGQHGHLPENFACYYNPVTNLLEPIGYDSNVARVISRYGGMITSPVHVYHGGIFGGASQLSELFEAREFMEHYVKQLNRMTDSAYIAQLFKMINSEMQENLKVLYKEYPYFDYFRRDYLASNAHYIRDQLDNPKDIRINAIIEADSKTINVCIDNLKDIPIEVVGIKDEERVIYKAQKHCVVSSTRCSKEALLRLVSLSGSHEQLTNSKEYYFVFTIHGSDRMLSAPVTGKMYSLLNKRRVSQDASYALSIMQKESNVRGKDYIRMDEKAKYVYIDNDCTIDEELIVPPGYRFCIKSGVTVDMINSASILSYSAIEFLGEENNGILICSSDANSHGLVVVDAKRKSLLNYVTFDRLGNPHGSGWEVSGAITFYQSEVEITNCLIKCNRSEDALNIIRSKYFIEKSKFINTLSDALDSDFSEGKILDTQFAHTGNDAIDISGSNLEIANIYIDSAGDKAISAGEKSIVSGNNIHISNSELAVTSKDNSQVFINKVHMNNNRVGFVCYQKKAEYGPGCLTIESIVENSNTKIPYLLEPGSSMEIDSILQQSNRENISDILYGNKYGKKS